MALNLRAGALALKALAAAISGVGLAQVGVARSSDARLVCMISLASGVFQLHLTTTTRRDQRYLCTFAYRLDGPDEEAAELAVMDAVDAFIAALMADLTLGGVCRSADIDLGLADQPEYLLQAAKEWREYPVVVSLRQYGAFSAA